jgi:hypothetical protein
MSLTKVTFSMIQGANFNVQDFGAKGDGVTDDTAAIQAAVNAVPFFPMPEDVTKGGWTVYFPPGRYLISQTIVIGLRRIILRGPGLIGSNGAAIVTADPDVTMIDYYTGNFDTLSVYGLQFEGPGADTGTGSALIVGRPAQPNYDFRIENCWFAKIPQACLLAKTGDGFHVSSCAMELSNFGISITETSLLGYAGQCVISDNRFSYNKFAGVIATAPQTQNMVIVGNLFTGNGSGYPPPVTNGAAIILQNTGAAIKNTLIASNNFFDNYQDIRIIGASYASSNTGIVGTNIVANSFDRTHEASITNEGAKTSITANKFLDVCWLSIAGNNAINVIGAADETSVSSNSVSNDLGPAVPLYSLSLGATTTNTIIGENYFTGTFGGIFVATGATWQYMPNGLFAKDALVFPSSFLNGWVNVGSGYADGSFFKTSDGIVSLNGNVSSGTPNSIIFQLPVGYRPNNNVRLKTANFADDAYVEIDTSGNVTLFGTPTTWYSLDGLSFVGA